MNAFVLVAILGLAVLMIVHEAGHLLAARAFGMRVVRFSIGFGPALWRYQAKGSETVYQVALIPFLAYVQIAGMNPFEEVDADDKSSYANASLIGRVSAIFAGPMANYLFASVLFFASLIIGGKPVPTTSVVVMDGPAKTAQMKKGDTILNIDGIAVTDWEQMRQLILARPNKELAVEVLRGQEHLTLKVTPQLKEGGGKIGVSPIEKQVPIGMKEALTASVQMPFKVVEDLVVGLSRIITGKEKPDFKGPVGIVKETSKAAERSTPDFLWFLAALSAYLGGFNLLPFPALDGGRLTFLAYEAVTRRKPNARVEANIHAFGLMLLLALITVVTFRGN
ncbi:MAG TPA: M50 family metallopeptidase [Polyangiaceae bacterium]|jgi:regulator of sigma E protease|nr:M50 family metallopeptidase [Polyangiaceae bacterium]